MIDELDVLIQNMLNKRLQILELEEQFVGCHQSKPKFDPPYDSPIENDFAYNIVKYLDNDVTFDKQVSVDTVCGRFRLDFIAHRSRRRIGFECDGKEFHDNYVGCSARDRWRDALILETGVVEVIYRFPGKDLVYNINDCLFILAACEPQLFSERELINLNQLASYDVIKKLSQMWMHGQIWQFDDSEMIYCLYKEFRYQYGVTVYRHHCNNSFLLERSNFAKKYGGGDLDYIMRQFDIEREANTIVL